MKIDRLIGILSVLLQQEKVTAPYLAEKFEVSRRTINRDIEAICKAGIPVVTIQGKNGGISIMEGYRIDKTLLTASDMQAILSGLSGLDSVSRSKNYQRLMEKLGGENATGSGRFSEERTAFLDGGNAAPTVGVGGPIRIDLASWYKDSLAPKIELIRSAIDRRERICFDYYAPSGESRRKVEPYLLVFRWSSWYVWGYCTDREACRMFKLNRLQHLVNTGEPFLPKELPEPDWRSEKLFPPAIPVEAVITPQMKWRLMEDYGPESFTVQEDGSLLFKWTFVDKDSLFGWLLSFGGQAELTKPEELRREFASVIETVAEKYR